MSSLAGFRSTLETSRQSALASAVARTQMQISTGKRLQSASDDPAAAARIGQLARVAADVDSWSANIGLAKSLTSQADTVLAHMSDQMTRVQELYVSAGNPALSASDRQSVALELRAIADDLDVMAATRNSLGQPLFAQLPSQPDQIPVGDGLSVEPAPSAHQLFIHDGVGLSDQIRAAADSLAVADPVARKSQYQGWLTTLDGLASHVAQAHADLGVRAQQIDQISDRLARQKLDVAVERSGLEDTDIGEAVARLNSQQLTLEAAQAAFARIHKRSLFDLLS